MEPQDQSSGQDNSQLQNNTPSNPVPPSGSTYPTNDQAPISSPEPQVVLPEQPKSGAKKWIILLVVLLVLGAGGYFAYAKLKPAKATSASTSATTKKDVDSITVGVVNGSTKLYTPNDADSYGQEVVNQIYEPLVTYQDKTKIVPLLATSWSNPNDTTWDFKLKHGVTFHNGHSMTAKDVVFSLGLATKQGADGTYSNTIKDVKAVNDYSVEITTSKPDPFLLNKLAFLMIVDSTQPGDSQDTMNATGPYQLKSGTKPSDSEIQLVAYDKYHGGHVYTRALNFKVEKDEASATSDLTNGTINMAGEFLEAKPTNLDTNKFSEYRITDNSVAFMTLNTIATGPLQNKSVREALRDSIDNKLLIKNANIVAQPESQLITQEIPGYNPNIPVPQRDVAKAKSLLAAAGYANGVKLTIEVTQTNVKVANEVAAEAKEAGFNLSIKPTPDFDTLINDVLDGKTQIGIISFSSDTLDAGDVFTTVVQQGGNYKSSTLDQNLSQLEGTMDQSTRLADLQKTSKFIYDEVAVIPMYSRYKVWFVDQAYVMQNDSMTASPGINFSEVYLK